MFTQEVPLYERNDRDLADRKQLLEQRLYRAVFLFGSGRASNERQLSKRIKSFRSRLHVVNVEIARRLVAYQPSFPVGSTNSYNLQPPLPQYPPVQFFPPPPPPPLPPSQSLKISIPLTLISPEFLSKLPSSPNSTSPPTPIESSLDRRLREQFNIIVD